MSEMEIAGWVLLVLAVLAVGLLVYGWLQVEVEEAPSDEWLNPEPEVALDEFPPATHRVWCEECFRVSTPFDPFVERNLCTQCKRLAMEVNP